MTFFRFRIKIAATLLLVGSSVVASSVPISPKIAPEPISSSLLCNYAGVWQGVEQEGPMLLQLVQDGSFLQMEFHVFGAVGFFQIEPIRIVSEVSLDQEFQLPAGKFYCEPGCGPALMGGFTHYFRLTNGGQQIDLIAGRPDGFAATIRTLTKTRPLPCDSSQMP